MLATEKPEVRAKLVAALGLGLTDEDLPFLEGALGDLAASVRAAVIDLLVRLPRSAVAERQVSRLLACVRTGGPNGLEVTITDALMADKLWAADALPTKAPDAQGLRQYATSLLIGRVPPYFWAEQFGLPLDAFVATALGAELAGPLLLGYSQAVCHHGVPPETDLRPLARALIDRTGRDGFEAGPSLGGLLALLNTAALAEIACASIGGPAMAAVLDALPAPWPEPVALAWLVYARRPERQSLTYWDPFWQSVRGIARLLPRDCLDHRTAVLPEPTNPAHTSATQDFNELVHLRRRIRLEIGG